MVQIINNNDIRIWTPKELVKFYPDLASDLLNHYPIGIKNSSVLYRESVETQRLNNLISEKILDDRYISDWKEGFCQKLAQKLNCKVFSSTPGISPSRSGYFFLDKNDSLAQNCALHFYVSLINNYFYIEIVTRNKLVQGKDKFKNFLKSQTITVSPARDYGIKFKIVYDFIRTYFKNSKFIPFNFNNLKLDGLEVIHSNCSNCSIHQAFFAKNTIYVDGMKVYGDVKYEIELLK